MEPQRFLGVPVDPLTLAGAVDACLAILDHPRDRAASFVHINPHSLVVARSDPFFHDALSRSDLRLPDGAGLLLVARLRRRPLPGRVAGPDLVTGLSSALHERGGARYFFYGSTDEVLRRIRSRIASQWPSITVAGTFAPAFRALSSEEEADHVRLINAARPDVLWVGMTAPKQECWVHRNRARLEVPLIGSIGAAFDYLAGTRRRSPLWFREHGLEWLPRLIREPRRLWRRTLVSLPLFLWYSLWESESGRARGSR